MYKTLSKELLDFISASPSCYHAIANIRNELIQNGFEELYEGSRWNLDENKNYFVIRNNSSIIAFKVPTKDFKGFEICASHSDSPSFKIKENAEISVSDKYVKLNTEKYGGMLMATWLDRPLSVAGRVIVKTDSGLETKLVNVDKDLLVIPNLAIHMNREANDGFKFNAQVDMLPLVGSGEAKNCFMDIIAESAGTKKDDIVGSDLFLYSRVEGRIWGACDEYVSSSQLDDLQCAFASLKGFIASKNEQSIPVLAVFDNEEVGSGTKQGADSTFLYDTLTRINSALSRTDEDYLRALASSFMVSADNAHAAHPNHGEKADPVNKPYMNNGIVIKFNANQKYTTDSVSEAMFKMILEKAGVPYQVFTNRSDMAGGSTLGNISNAHVSLNTVDIGLAQLAMHSTYETAGVKDTYYLVKGLETFFSTVIEEKGNGKYDMKF